MDELTRSIKEHTEFCNNVNISKEDVDYNFAQKHIPLFERLDELSYSIVVVVDYYKNNYFYVSKKFNPLFGLKAPTEDTKPFEWFRSIIHPDDYVVNDAGVRGRKYVLEQPIEERKNYKLVHELRVFNEDKKWIRVIVQDYILELDAKGDFWLVIKVIDLSPNQDIEAPGCSVLQNVVTNETIFSMVGTKQSSCGITKREKELLQLISKGMASKQIADKLCISINTVNNHRKNILRKLKVQNASEAIQQALRLGIIS